MVNCKFCNREYKPLGLSSHQRTCKLNPNRVDSTIYLHTKANGSWRKGLTKETDERIRRNAVATSSALRASYANGTKKPSVHSKEFIENLSTRQSLKNSGGKSKWFEVSSIKVQGTWEYNIALKLNELNIQWEKPKTNTDLFKYKKDGKTKSYAPDFYLPEYNIYLEIKGYWWGNDKEKMDIVISTYPNTKFIIVEKQDYLECLTIEA